MTATFISKIALAVSMILPLRGALPAADGDNPIIGMEVVLAPGQTCSMRIAEAVPIFDTRAAKRTLAMLEPGKPVTIHAIDRYGLKVRGMGKNGPLTGWIGRKSAFGKDSPKLKALEAFYERQIAVEGLIAQKRPALGMTLLDLKRILGPATSHNIVAEGSDRRETAIWIMNEKVDLNDTLELGTNSALLKVEVETGRITVGLIEGVAKSMDVNIEGIATEIPTVPAPVQLPFEIATPGAQSPDPARSVPR